MVHATCARWVPSPLAKKGAEPLSNFSAFFYCGKTAGYIKMPLGMEVGFSPGKFVLDGDPAPSPKRGQTPLPNFEGWGCEFRNYGALPVIADFVALEQRIILVKTRSESV